MHPLVLHIIPVDTKAAAGLSLFFFTILAEYFFFLPFFRCMFSVPPPRAQCFSFVLTKMNEKSEMGEPFGPISPSSTPYLLYYSSLFTQT